MGLGYVLVLGIPTLGLCAISGRAFYFRIKITCVRHLQINTPIYKKICKKNKTIHTNIEIIHSLKYMQ